MKEASVPALGRRMLRDQPLRQIVREIGRLHFFRRMYKTNVSAAERRREVVSGK
jgi:hypothetical protein